MSRSYGQLGLFLLLAAACRPLNADILLDFENLPDLYFFAGGGQNIGNFYTGLDFEANVTGLSVSRFGGYNAAAYPPHSGDVVIWDPVDLTMTISFTPGVESAGFWYTSLDPLTLQAFDLGANLLGTVVGNPNTDGTTGISSFVSIQAPGIQSIAITSTPGAFVIDDMTYSSQASTPEPTPLMLMGSVIFTLALSRLKIIWPRFLPSVPDAYKKRSLDIQQPNTAGRGPTVRVPHKT